MCFGRLGHNVGNTCDRKQLSKTKLECNENDVLRFHSHTYYLRAQLLRISDFICTYGCVYACMNAWIYVRACVCCVCA